MGRDNVCAFATHGEATASIVLVTQELLRDTVVCGFNESTCKTHGGVTLSSSRARGVGLSSQCLSSSLSAGHLGAVDFSHDHVAANRLRRSHRMKREWDWF